MAQINSCLKRTFIVFNVFFAIIGCIIIGIALLSQTLTSDGGEAMEGRFFGLVILYIVGGVTMVIAILGAYGAHKESKVFLIVFLLSMLIGAVLMLYVGVPVTARRPELNSSLEEKFRELLPLDTARTSVQEVVTTLQTKLHCCGLFSYRDWEGNIPDSCLCGPEEEMEGKCQSVDYRNIMFKKSIYIKTCFPIIKHYFMKVVDITIGVLLSLAALAILGVVLSSVMIHQLRCPGQPAILVTVPAIFTAAPPKYQELHNPPGY